MISGTGPGTLELGELHAAPAQQQPQWREHPDHQDCCATLAAAPGLVHPAEIAEVTGALAVVARGGARLLQLGDCAESFHEIGVQHTRAKLALLHGLADELAEGTGQRVVRVGRLGGQFAKPRSQPHEHIDGVELPAFRGHMINSEEPTFAARTHDPHRMVRAYQASAEVLRTVGEDRAARAGAGFAGGPWSSHDALVIDYEANLVRTEEGVRFLASTHLPWIGDRTRQPDSAHVRLLSTVANPVALKVGPGTATADLLELCALLDPNRTPGRLTLIVRMGADRVEELLPPVLTAVRRAGHPVVWLSDPMHGNTIRAGGVKTRLLSAVTEEAVRFTRVLRGHGEHPAGLHLEAATAEVTECLGGAVDGPERLPECYTTLCDPRLNPAQVRELLHEWIQI